MSTIFRFFVLFGCTVQFLAVICNSFSPEHPTDRRVLVLLDDFAITSSHSIFFKSLETRGFELDFKLADDPKIALQRYGQYLYDALIIFSPSVDRFGGSLNTAAVMEFLDSGHDLILAADESASDLIREIATECGVDFDEDPSAMVIDHTSYAVSDTEGDHSLIAADNFIKSDVILGSKTIEAPIIFQGIGHSVNPSNNLVLKVLSASASAYSANPKSKLSNPPSVFGSAISLVSILQDQFNLGGNLDQVHHKGCTTLPKILPPLPHKTEMCLIRSAASSAARNNARVLISGSLRMFSNQFFKSSVQKAGSPVKHEKSGNELLLTEISKWVFHERGHLKAVNVGHHKVGEVNEPGMYRINDDLEYSVEIYQWSGASWEPYVADDAQVQFYMMSPYVLKTLSTNKKGLYYTSFKVPDVYGVFQFKIEYEGLGYSSLSLSKQIPVRPFRHNEYERFITTAFPYYGASFSMMTGFLVFTLVYLYNK